MKTVAVIFLLFAAAAAIVFTVMCISILGSIRGSFEKMQENILKEISEGRMDMQRRVSAALSIQDERLKQLAKETSEKTDKLIKALGKESIP